jgi:ribokinase
MATIAVVGSVNLDLVAQAARLPAPGETITGAVLHRFPGGKGANQALAARRLGADVCLVACVGDDVAADEALALLREGGVDLSQCVVRHGESTGTALIAVSAAGENQIVVAPGANRSLTPEVLQLPATDAVICQLEVPADTVAAVARACAGFLCVNLAPATHVDVSILQRADLVVVNELESDWYGDSLGACQGLVATTRGSGPATLALGGDVVAEVMPPAVNAIDTTGAGDTFTAALTVALIEGQAPDAALRFACAAAAVTTTRLGAQPALPCREEVAHGADL